MSSPPHIDTIRSKDPCVTTIHSQFYAAFVGLWQIQRRRGEHLAKVEGYDKEEKELVAKLKSLGSFLDKHAKNEDGKWVNQWHVQDAIDRAKRRAIAVKGAPQ